MSSTTAPVGQLVTNVRGIPRAPFVENPEAFVGPNEPTEVTLGKFQEMLSKYKFMRSNLENRVKSLREKIPLIQNSLRCITLLLGLNKSKNCAIDGKTDDPDAYKSESVDIDFELQSTLYMRSTVGVTDSVHLWLGANVMMEYPIDEAHTMLKSKLAIAQSSIKSLSEDIDFLQEQVTTMEVNIARVYNWDVKRRKAKIAN